MNARQSCQQGQPEVLDRISCTHQYRQEYLCFIHRSLWGHHHYRGSHPVLVLRPYRQCPGSRFLILPIFQHLPSLHQSLKHPKLRLLLLKQRHTSLDQGRATRLQGKPKPQKRWSRKRRDVPWSPTRPPIPSPGHPLEPRRQQTRGL